MKIIIFSPSSKTSPYELYNEIYKRLLIYRSIHVQIYENIPLQIYKFAFINVMSWSSSNSFILSGCQLSNATLTVLKSFQAHRTPPTVMAMGVTKDATPKASESRPYAYSRNPRKKSAKSKEPCKNTAGRIT